MKGKAPSSSGKISSGVSSKDEGEAESTTPKKGGEHGGIGPGVRINAYLNTLNTIIANFPMDKHHTRGSK